MCVLCYSWQCLMLSLCCGGACSRCCLSFFFFIFKQKTAYEMRNSDWSSDVCSSDLIRANGVHSRFRSSVLRASPAASLRSLPVAGLQSGFGGEELSCCWVLPAFSSPAPPGSLSAGRRPAPAMRGHPQQIRTFYSVFGRAYEIGRATV